MIVKRYILILLLLPAGAWGGDRAVILTGAIGGGLFVPTGDDGDVASPSVALEFSGSIAVGPHWGLSQSSFTSPSAWPAPRWPPRLSGRVAR